MEVYNIHNIITDKYKLTLNFDFFEKMSDELVFISKL